MADSLLILLVFLAYIAFVFRRGMTYLHIFQQEEYDGSRLLRWMLTNWVFDKRLSLALLIISILWIFVSGFLVLLLTFIVFAAVVVMEKDPRQHAKKKLVMTPRAQRTFFIMLGLAALMGLWCFVVYIPFIWILNVHIIPLLLILANVALTPFENKNQDKFWAEATQKLVEVKPTVIGVTGSYGKTSVKHILGHILKTHAPTLITPGSVNTPMGIARIVREQLEPHHKYFVVEMGAYGRGSIARLCDLTPPDMGIITAVGQAHYERFQSLENVSQTKFELAEAVLENSGKVIVHERTLRFEKPRALTETKRSSFIVCGEPPPIDPAKRTGDSYLDSRDVHIEKIVQLPGGLEVTLIWNGTIHRLDIPLYGIHHGHNAAMAFAAAMTLGIPAGNIITALKSTPQITHRLEVKRQGDGSILIDDAYNSNPAGFRSALDLLKIIAPQGRKILVTPGMVELGSAHTETHEQIGRHAGEICDLAIVVVPQRIPSFIEGFKATGGQKPIIEVQTFQEASHWLTKNKEPGDIVLLENDLPDLYERIPVM